MMLRSNLLNEVLCDEGRPLQGMWLAAIDERGQVVGVAAHVHRGTMTLEAAGAVASLAVACAAASRVMNIARGFLG